MRNTCPNQHNIALESFGGQSVCLDHDRQDPWRFHSADGVIDLENYGASCHQHKCTLGKGLQLVFENTTYVCPVEGGSIKIDVTTEKGKLQGSVHCPICGTVCNETVCSSAANGDLVEESESVNTDVLHKSDAQVPAENLPEDVDHSKEMTAEEVVTEDITKHEESDEKQMETDAITTAPVPPTLKTDSDTLGEQSNTNNTKESTMDTEEQKQHTYAEKRNHAKDVVTTAPVPPTLKTESNTLGEQSNTDNTKENTTDTDEHKDSHPPPTTHTEDESRAEVVDHQSALHNATETEHDQREDGTDEANAHEQEAVKVTTETEGIIFTTLSPLLSENNKNETTTNPEHPVDLLPNTDNVVPITTLPPPDLKAEPEITNDISNQQNATQTDVEPSKHEEVQEPSATV
ncbi:Leishmanolysin-like peptidase [Clonorchis sinensis]|uniref:Leishmanolysin-like peptidase n=1 Tax=Clonorchis sinensis TaxID=79923 RepID=A0A8T1MTX8_CLOSI|nr:Leishmanolysin-like peptidase [Clonorchis sinensis]